MRVEHVTLVTPHGTARGMWHIGKNLSPILILHGYFGANRVGPARLYVKIANALGMNGFDVLRLDAVGAGDSDGDYEDVTFSSFIDDFLNGANWIMNQMDIEANRPILIGHSMGANVALHMAEFGNWKGLILMAPEVMPKGGIDRLLTEYQLKEININGHTIRKGVIINASFIDEIRKDSALNIAESISIPTAIIQGVNDELYDPLGAEHLSKKIRKCKLFYIDNADHNFLGPMCETELIKYILESVEWINRL